MGKIPETIPSTPTDEKPLWEQIQDASRHMCHCASVYAESPTELHRQALLKAGEKFNELAQVQNQMSAEVWNPKLDQNALCDCGHTYYRHFDSWDDMAAIGCKYCGCHEFQPKGL